MSGGDDGTVRIWDAQSGKCRKILTGHSASVSCLFMSADNKCLISGSKDATIMIWDLPSGCLPRILSGHSGEIVFALLSADTKKVISNSWDNTIRIWDVNSGDCHKAHYDGSPEAEAALGLLSPSVNRTCVLSRSTHKLDYSLEFEKRTITIPCRFSNAFGTLAGETICALLNTGESCWFSLRRLVPSESQKFG